MRDRTGPDDARRVSLLRALCRWWRLAPILVALGAGALIGTSASLARQRPRLADHFALGVGTSTQAGGRSGEYLTETRAGDARTARKRGGRRHGARGRRHKSRAHPRTPKHRRKGHRHRRKHSVHPALPTWITLPGTVQSYSDAAVLTAENFDGFTGGGYLWAIGTRLGGPIMINYTQGIPAGTTSEVVDTLMTEPVAAHPLGLVVITLLAKFPQNGINPPHADGYFSVFDAATGARLVTSAPVSEESVRGELLGYVAGNIRLEAGGPTAGSTDNLATVTPAGDVTRAPFPGVEGTPGNPGSSVLGHPIAGRFLVGGEGESMNKCPTIWVVDIATEAVVSQTPCLADFADPFLGVYFDGSAIGVPGTAALLSATGGQLTAVGQFNQGAPKTSEPVRFAKPGVRSDLTMVQNEGYSYFVSMTNWATVFTASPQQTFTTFGIADDDVWVDTSHWEGDEYIGGPVVIDGHTGREVASSWSVFPVAGGTGWTLTSENSGDACCASEFLLRSAGPLLASLHSVP
jgi:hypothetical protein